MNINRVFGINLEINEKKAESLKKDLSKILNNEDRIGYYKPKDIKKIINSKLLNDGWTEKLKVYRDNDKYIHFYKNGIGLQVQMGHYGQAYVDILKLSLAHSKNKIDLGAMILLGDKDAKFGNNASFENISSDLNEYNAFLDCPIILLEIE